jgi:hypothetical protein
MLIPIPGSSGARRPAAHSVPRFKELAFVRVPDLQNVAGAAGSIGANLYATAARTISGTPARSVDATCVLLFHSQAAALGVAHTQNARRHKTKTTLINFIVVTFFFHLLKPRSLKWRLKRPVSVCAAETREKGGYQKLTQQESQIRNTNTVHN